MERGDEEEHALWMCGMQYGRSLAMICWCTPICERASPSIPNSLCGCSDRRTCHDTCICHRRSCRHHAPITHAPHTLVSPPRGVARTRQLPRAVRRWLVARERVDVRTTADHSSGHGHQHSRPRPESERKGIWPNDQAGAGGMIAIPHSPLYRIAMPLVG